MRNHFGYIIALLVVLCLSTACSSPKTFIEFENILREQGVDPSKSAILIVRLEDNQSWSYGGERIDTRFVAASTSKIPHIFIALESEYAAGAETLFKWDGQQRWAAGWNQNQTLAQAYARSAVWVFQEITQALGPNKMAMGIQMFEYGNQDTGGPDDLTTYWLNGPLKISVREQIEFLTKLYNEDFLLSQKTYLTGKDIMKAGRTDGRSAKTGWYYSDEEADIGWYVGWQDEIGLNGDETYVFAFNMDINDRENDPPKRKKVVDAALVKIIVNVNSIP